MPTTLEFWPRRVRHNLMSIQCRHSSQFEAAQTSELLSRMAHELKQRGDWRHLDDLHDAESNELYLQALPSAWCSVEESARQPNQYRELHPHAFDSQTAAWTMSNKINSQPLERESVLQVASWNLFFSRVALEARTVAALGHLRALFGERPGNLVVMLQEVRRESLDAILADKWVQHNFVLTDKEPPRLFDQGEEWPSEDQEPGRPSRYFTVMMLPRRMAVSNCFRVPFVSSMNRDALVVDIALSDGDPESKNSEEVLRLCTTHLESLYDGKELRFKQLSKISGLLKGELSFGKTIRGGLVGGDMNSVDPAEHEIHRTPEIGLEDVWRSELAPTPPNLKPFQKDYTYGRARGNTWGYQSDKARKRTRYDKFLFTGRLKTLAVEESQDVTGHLGRFGIGLKTKHRSGDVWVSDHFGIAVGITSA